LIYLLSGYTNYRLMHWDRYGGCSGARNGMFYDSV